jgi:hypothetical protein
MSIRSLSKRCAFGAPLLLLALSCSPSAAEQSQARVNPLWTKFCLKGENTRQVCFESQANVGEELVDREVFAERQAALKAELERRAEVARRRIEQRTQE